MILQYINLYMVNLRNSCFHSLFQIIHILIVLFAPSFRTGYKFKNELHFAIIVYNITLQNNVFNLIITRTKKKNILTKTVITKILAPNKPDN